MSTHCTIIFIKMAMYVKYEYQFLYIESNTNEKYLSIIKHWQLGCLLTAFSRFSLCYD